MERAAIIRLIIEHLEFEGLHASRVALEQEFSEFYGATMLRGSFTSPTLDSSSALSRESRLAQLLGGVSTLLAAPPTAAAAVAGDAEASSAKKTTKEARVLFEDDGETVEWGSLSGLVAHMVRLKRDDNAAAEFAAFADVFFMMVESFSSAAEVAAELRSAGALGPAERESVVEIAELWLCEHFAKLPAASQVAALPSVRLLVEALAAAAADDADEAAPMKALRDALDTLESGAAGDRSRDPPPTIDFPLTSPRTAARQAASTTFRAKSPRVGLRPAEGLLSAWPSTELESLALQWTVIEWGMFAAIPRHEFMHTAWTWKEYTHAADHVRDAIAHFDAVSEWVMSEVLRDDLATAEERAKVIAAFVRTAGLLLQLCNFQGAYEIVSALDRKAIKQLEQTWRIVPSAFREHLEGILAVFDLADNKRNYRAALQRAMGEGRAIVPQLSLHFGDLVMLEDDTVRPKCHPERSELHNWGKWCAVHGKVSELLHFQERPYDVAADDGAANFLRMRWQRHRHVDEKSSRAADKALLATSKEWAAAGH
jgi:hypothetical protein